MKRFWPVWLLVLCAACVTVSAQETRIRLATTTSTDNSGLLAALNPPFEKLTGYRVDVIAVGTGKALALGENGDADVVLVHARIAEDRFIDAGFGVNRREVMHNDFVILGPAADPAGIRGKEAAADALATVARSRRSFVSRGDNSGTHQKEKALWAQTGMSPSGHWYKEAGQGMGAVLTMAGDLQAYTLTDRGTYLSMKDKLDLVILAQGDPALFNPYGVMAVSPARHTHVNYMGAMAYIAWITSVEGQRIIGGYTKDGEVLFLPDAVVGR